jgi:hypothetical protein
MLDAIDADADALEPHARDSGSHIQATLLSLSLVITTTISTPPWTPRPDLTSTIVQQKINLERVSDHQHDAQLENATSMTSMTQSLRPNRGTLHPVAFQIEDPDRACSRNLHSQRSF